MTTDDSRAPLSAEEEAMMRVQWPASYGMAYPTAIARLLATLDRERLAAAPETPEHIREAVALIDAAFANWPRDITQRARNALSMLEQASLRAAAPSTPDGGLREAAKKVLEAWDYLLEGPLATVTTVHSSALIGVSDRLIALRHALAAAHPQDPPERER